MFSIAIKSSALVKSVLINLLIARVDLRIREMVRSLGSSSIDIQARHTMNVYDVMTPRPIVISSNNSLKEALEKMRQTSCHHLPVISSDKHLVGVLSVHDCQRVLGELLEKNALSYNETLARTISVSRAMTPAPIIIEPDAPAHEAARLMLQHYIGCLPVMRGETLVGIVTNSDLLMAFIILSERPFPAEPIKDDIQRRQR